MIMLKSAAAAGVLTMSLSTAPMALAEDGGASELWLEGPNGSISFVVEDADLMRGRLEQGQILLDDINCGLAPDTRNEAAGVCAATINAREDFDPFGWTAYFEGERYDVNIVAVRGGSAGESAKSWATLLPVMIDGKESGFYLDLDGRNVEAVEAALARYAARDSVSLWDFLTVLEMDENGESAGWPFIDVASDAWPYGTVEVSVCGTSFKVRFSEVRSANQGEESWAALLPVMVDGKESGYYLDLDATNSEAVKAALADYATRESVSYEEFLTVLEMDKDGESAGWPHVEISDDEKPVGTVEVSVCGVSFKVRFTEKRWDVIPAPDSDASSDMDLELAGASAGAAEALAEGAQRPDVASKPEASATASAAELKKGEAAASAAPASGEAASVQLPVTGRSGVSVASGQTAVGAKVAKTGVGVGSALAVGFAALLGGACFLLLRRV